MMSASGREEPGKSASARTFRPASINIDPQLGVGSTNPRPTNDSVASASTKAGSRRVTCVAIAEAAAGARWRTTMRTGPAPVARAARRLAPRLDRDDRPDRSRHERPADRPEQDRQQPENLPGLQHQRHDRAEREDNVDCRQDDEKVGDPHEGLIDEAPRVARGRPDQRARDEREEAGDERDSREARAPWRRRAKTSRPMASAPRMSSGAAGSVVVASRPSRNHDRGTRRDRSIS